MLENRKIITYYLDFLIQSSLTSIKFQKNQGHIDKNSLNDINYFLINYGEKDKKTFKDNLCILINHLEKLEKKDKYKIVFFPFVNEFIEVSKTREDKIYSAPIYFSFDIDKKFQKLLFDLKNFSINFKSKIFDSLFDNAELFFNNYYASSKIFAINHEDLDNLKKELNDEEFEKRYPKKDKEFFFSVLKKYAESSNLYVKKSDSLYQFIKNFNEALASKINKNENLNTLIQNEVFSLIAVVNTEALIQSDLITLGLINAYKSSIIPYFENISPNDKLNRILYFHPKRYFEKVDIETSPKNTLNITEEKLKDLQKSHFGSFSSKFALTLSQRLALSAYLSALDIIPVNGPPGTGKTALLRGIFADYIVKNALKAKISYDKVKNDPYSLIDTGMPILGTSSVRQAINNIIEGISGGFEEADKLDNPLFKRWLKLPQYDADKKIDLINNYCVVPQIRNSENKYENGVLFTGIDNIFEYLENINPEELEEDFVEFFEKSFEKSYELNEIIEFLSQKIIQNISVINRTIENSENLIKTYEKLDTSVRFETFFYSLHLLEAFFIQNLKKINRPKISNCPICGGNIINEEKYFKCSKCDFTIKKNNKIKVSTIEDLTDLLNETLKQNETTYGLKKNGKFFEIVEKPQLSNIQRLFVITPLFPMLTVTMHSLYGAFKEKKENGYVLNESFFDLVLSDESGMILAPVALPALFSAKKMVIVGDEKQIEPVYPFDEIVDKSIIKNRLENIDYDEFKKNHSAIATNFLKLANRSVWFESFDIKPYEKNALWLKEHFRCKDEIIEYCNEIVYKGILIPKVRSFNPKLYLDGKYPSMKIINVDSEVKNNSSKKEAEAIVSFLTQNIEKLTKLYNEYKNENLTPDQFYRHIGIVTPFNNQKRTIKKYLKDAGRYNLQKILVGTVHAFQGSEREIILFSPAIDKNFTGEHFTNQDDGNMMNVAVSRAKSAFWVFGNKNGMKNAGIYTKTLVEYIEKNFSCEIAQCPLCGGCIIEDEKCFKCENYHWSPKTKQTQGCRFIIWKENKTTASKIDKETLLKLLTEEIEINGKNFYFDKNEKYFIKEKTKTCPKCGGKLILKTGRFGKFYGCENFPKCKYTESANEI
ncbi:AAA domain-containing protein [Caminibacter pacificus]|uniref:Topoisomerase-like DNA binding C4 zinc finger protein n=1 Tax=Caminibacter pacificus TaxID=1424653 RepID=A0AAJ4UX91_9BACT|nr:AAA domain-containing protein [Caminibacter pacificus]QCI29091.1 hypothetical protein C6V80_09000 [Caminibacter pacificus]ROR39088.1 topoisomerase-like DNA binding C4 zinc finger protein [Caminibacter pacificus]